MSEVAEGGGGQVASCLQPGPHDGPHKVSPHLHRVELQPASLVETALGGAAAGEARAVNLAGDVVADTGAAGGQAVERAGAATGLPGQPHLPTLLLLPGVDLDHPGPPQQDPALLAVHWEEEAGEVALVLPLPRPHPLTGPDHRELQLAAGRLPAGAPPVGRVLVQAGHLLAVVVSLHPQRVPALKLNTLSIRSSTSRRKCNLDKDVRYVVRSLKKLGRHIYFQLWIFSFFVLLVIV